MNKAQLVEALTTRIGDRRTAAAAVDGLVDVIVETVGSGRSVTLTGFGVFEPRRRAARVARNPRTGETVPVPETIVPSFRPGAAFREQIGNSDEAAAGATSAPRRAPRTGSGRSAAAASAAEAPSANGTAPRTTRSRSTRATGTSRTTKAGTTGTSKTAAAKNGTAAGTAAKATPAKKTTAAAKKTGTATPAKRTSRTKAAGT